MVGQGASIDPSLISALAALAGALVGGLASLGSSWLTQWIQAKDKTRERERSRQEQLFSDFIEEASRLYGDALANEKDDVLALVRIYAIVGRIRLTSSPAVVASAEQTLNLIIDTYLGPNKSLQDLRTMMAEGKMDFLMDFSAAGRGELGLRPAPSRSPTA